MIILCIVLYILGALPVYAIAHNVRNSENKWYDLSLVAALWPLTVSYVIYLYLKEQ